MPLYSPALNFSCFLSFTSFAQLATIRWWWSIFCHIIYPSIFDILFEAFLLWILDNYKLFLNALYTGALNISSVFFHCSWQSTGVKVNIFSYSYLSFCDILFELSCCDFSGRFSLNYPLQFLCFDPLVICWSDHWHIVSTISLSFH